MTEKEKMVGGYLYQGDRSLAEERLAAKRILEKYNHSDPGDFTHRRELLGTLLGKMGSAHIESPFYCDYGYNIELGDGFYANHNCIILDCAKVRIGKNVFFAPGVSLYTAGHPLDPALRSAGYEYALPITIGDDVWVGGNTVINPGVTIGRGSVIGSGSVVTKDIPEYCVAVGNPCRVIRRIEKGCPEKYQIAAEDQEMLSLVKEKE